MIVIDKQGQQYPYESKDWYMALRRHLRSNYLISLDYVISGPFGSTKKRDIFYAGNPKYISKGLVVPIGLINNPETKQKPRKQVLEIIVDTKKYVFIEPNYKEEGTDEKWRHCIAGNQNRVNRWEDKPHYKRSPKTYVIGRSHPCKLTVSISSIEEQLKDIGLSIDKIKPY